MKMKLRILLTASWCLLAAACQKSAEAPKTSGPTAPAPAKQGTIGVTLLTLQNSFYQ